MFFSLSVVVQVRKSDWNLLSTTHVYAMVLMVETSTSTDLELMYKVHVHHVQPKFIALSVSMRPSDPCTTRSRCIQYIAKVRHHSKSDVKPILNSVRDMHIITFVEYLNERYKR